MKNEEKTTTYDTAKVFNRYFRNVGANIAKTYSSSIQLSSEYFCVSHSPKETIIEMKPTTHPVKPAIQ